jgi:hypothetical protein
MNTDKEVISAVRDRVCSPLDVSVDDAVQRNLWVSVVNSIMHHVSNSAGHFVRGTINNAMNEYEY